ncbi:MAG: THUMP domain-containing protein [Bdellovibrionota bacterium]|nr:THUMP domain-containing protein [Bdellovibrionota bacterium]
MNFLKFRISCPFDTEEYCLKELVEKASLLNIEIVNCTSTNGEIRFESDLASVEKLQAYLKLPNRISLIIANFKARDLPKLFQKVSKIPWRNYLINKEFQLKVLSKKSRLNNEKKISATFEEAIEKYYVAQNPKNISNPISTRLSSTALMINLKSPLIYQASICTNDPKDFRA